MTSGEQTTADTGDEDNGTPTGSGEAAAIDDQTDDSVVTDPELDEETADTTNSGGGASNDMDDADSDSIGLLEAKDRAIDAAEELLDGPIEGVTSVEENDDGWLVLVESVERSAVPDTQDIIGRYALQLDSDGTLREYELRQRFRRGEMEGEELA